MPRKGLTTSSDTGRTTKKSNLKKDFSTPEKYTTTYKQSNSGKRLFSASVGQYTLFASPKKTVQRGKFKPKWSKNIADIEKIMSKIGIDDMKVKEYIQSPFDLSDAFQVKAVDLLKQHNGRGLFANRSIAKGTTIGAYTGEEYASSLEFEQHLAENPSADNSYAMSLGRKIIDASVKGNFTRYINFSDSQDNVEFQERIRNGRKVVEVVAIRDIGTDEQILVNYNTHDQKVSQYYYFLNPNDGWLSANEYYALYKSWYSGFVVGEPHTELQLYKNDILYLSQVAEAVIRNQPLRCLGQISRLEVDLLIIKANSSEQMMDFKDVDTLTPLMIACYLGQCNNANWLIKNGANVNQQQNQSGNCPLFFALMGYRLGLAKPGNYVQIMQSLISHGANPAVHDRADSTFLHKAITSLSNADFKKIFDALERKLGSLLDGLYSYIDESNLDIVQYAITLKQFEKLRYLLEANPGYLQLYSAARTSTCKKEISIFRTAILDYKRSELLKLYKILSSGGMGLSDAHLESMGVITNERSFYRQHP